jgi:hypothetical protein
LARKGEQLAKAAPEQARCIWKRSQFGRSWPGANDSFVLTQYVNNTKIFCIFTKPEKNILKGGGEMFRNSMKKKHKPRQYFGMKEKELFGVWYNGVEKTYDTVPVFRRGNSEKMAFILKYGSPTQT